MLTLAIVAVAIVVFWWAFTILLVAVQLFFALRGRSRSAAALELAAPSLAETAADP